MRRTAAITITLVSLILLAKPVVAAPSGANLLTSINQARTEKQIPILKNSYTLRRAASARASDMARFHYFSHRSALGRTYQYWLANGPARFNKTGENIGRNYTTTSAVATAWLASGGHRKNLLDSAFTHVGTAVRPMMLNGRVMYVYVAVFGRLGS